MLRLGSPLLLFALGYITGWYRKEDPWVRDLDRYLRTAPNWRKH